MIQNETEQPLSFVDSLLAKEKNLASITSTVQLPSKGKLNGIAKDGEVILRQMNTHDEKIRTGSKDSFLKTMASIINNCIVSPKGLDSYDLTIPDFIYLMYQLRIISYGDIMSLQSECPNPKCKKKISKIDVDLTKLEIVSLADDKCEPFKVKLPKLDVEVSYNLLRIRDIDTTTKVAEKELNEREEHATTQILDPKAKYDDEIELQKQIKQIKAINDRKVSSSDLSILLNGLPAADYSILSNALESISFGINTIVEKKCPYCGKSIFINLRTDQNFFRYTPKE